MIFLWLGFANGVENTAIIEADNKGDYKRLFELSKKACDKNNVLGCAKLAALYSAGIYVKQDYKKAVKYRTKACDGGDMLSCGSLGALYWQGNGVKKDLHKAVKLLERSCVWAIGANIDKKITDSNGLFSCIALGYILRDSSVDFGVLFAELFNDDLYKHAQESTTQMRNLNVAYAVYGVLCDTLNYAEGCVQYGTLKFRENNLKSAFEYYNKAMNKGSAGGYYMIGSFFRYGSNITPIDYKKAKELFSISCNMGYKLGCDELAKLKQEGF
ncbi:MAG: tetratricopeptide repeat protein [Helicobacteraceae bacterium]|nr:tetratricopeptide repeat protein [Helicobacteraceae bacterium]